MKPLTLTQSVFLALCLQNIAHAQVRLTDVVTFGADASGSAWLQPDVWETRPGGNYNNWLQSLPDGTFINGPSDANVQPDIVLHPGTNTFRVYANPGVDNPNFGISLFLNGANTPSIAAFGPMLTNNLQLHSFTANGASATWSSIPGPTPQTAAAGTLSFTDSNEVVTLTDFYLATPSVFNLDQAGNATLGPDGVTDYVGGFTLVVTANSMECTPPPTGIVSWWPAEGSANDAIGTNNGTLMNGVTYATGEKGQGFLFGTTNGAVRMVGDSILGGSPGSFTLECWINPADIINTHPLFEWNDQNFWGVHFHIAPGQPFNSNPGPGELYANIVDSYGGWHQLSSPGGVVVSNQFQHVALTYDQSAGVATIYCNGQIVGQQNIGSFTPRLAGYDLYLGRRMAPAGEACSFTGVMDEPAVYNRALSATEIQFIYHAGAAGKCLPVMTVPAISNFSPLAATNGAVVAITGTNFSATVSEDIVYFGAVRATVLTATESSLTVLVPPGATYAPITVTVAGLTAWSGNSFMPTFNGAASGSISLSPRLDLPAGDGSGQAIIADVDGDGKPDLLVNSGSPRIMSIYRNLGQSGTIQAGSFAPRVDVPMPGNIQNAVLADVDGDGKLDIVVLDRDANQVHILKNISTPGNIDTNAFVAVLNLTAGNDPRGVVVRDLDGDGLPDIAVANWADNTVSIFHNLGTANGLTTNSFAAPIILTVGEKPQDLKAADLDGDGKVDLVTANNNYGTSASVSVLHNTSQQGSISFDSAVSLPGLPTCYWLAIGDLDGDGKPDIAVSSFDQGQSVSVYRNLSSPGSLTPSSFAANVDFSVGGWGNGVALGDLDGDGKLDLAVVTQLPDHLSIFKNVSSPGSFTASSLAPRVDFPAGWNPNGPAIGDLDGDGRPDIAFAVGYGATLSVYQNTSPNVKFFAPFIMESPTNQTVVAGGALNLTVVAGGTDPLRYQWSFNGASISGATNATLTLTNVHVSQTGNYQVTVANGYGSVLSSNAVVTVQGQDILIYTYTGSEQVVTLGNEMTYNYVGEMFFIPASTNGTFIGWAVLNHKKQYWVSPFADYLLITVPGKAGHTYTVLGRAGDGVDGNGHPYLWSNFHRGQNSQLPIGAKKKFFFPAFFDCNDTRVYPDPQAGNMIWRESTSAYQFTVPETQAANNNGRTMADLVNALTKSLEKQGYQRQ